MWGRAEHYAPAALARPISIHAPVWGRAYTPNLENPPVADFNSRPRVGAGQTAWANLQIAFIFQFTPPCGGGLDEVLAQTMAEVISIHAPVWGRARTWIRCRSLPAQISIHAPVWGRA